MQSKSCYTAVAVVPTAPAVLERLQTLRTAQERAIRPPCLLLVFPFVDLQHVDVAARRVLAHGLAALPACRVRMTRLETVRQGRGHFAVYLGAHMYRNNAALDEQQQVQPEEVRETPLDQVLAVLRRALPAHQDQRTKEGGFQLRMLLGQFRSQTAVDDFLRGVNATLEEHMAAQAMQFDVQELAVLTRQDAEHTFRVARRLPLAATSRRVACLGPLDLPGYDANTTVVAANAAVGGSGNLVAPALRASGRQDDTNIFQVTDAHVRLVFSAERRRVLQSVAGAGGPSRTLFLVDTSSSMRSHIEHVRAAVAYMLENLGAALQPEFIAYSTTARRVTPLEAQNMPASGMTSFESAFTAAQQFILGETEVDSRVNICFMTDGRDTASQALPRSIQMFRTFLANCRRTIVLHTIGFSRSHNAQFLDQIKDFGSEPGTYRYAESGNDLEQTFGEIFDFLATNDTAELHVANQVMHVNLAHGDSAADDQDGNAGVVYGDVLVPRSAAVDALFRVRGIDQAFDLDMKKLPAASVTGSGGGCGDAVCRTSEAEKDEDAVKADVAGTAIDKLPRHMFEAAEHVQLVLGDHVSLDFERAPVDAFCVLREIEDTPLVTAAQLEGAQQMISAINACAVARAVREPYLELRDSVQATLDQYHTLFDSITRNSLRPESMSAQLNSLRFEGQFSKARRQRAMQRRAAGNAQKMEAMDAKLQRLTPDMSVFATPEMDDIICPLSGDTVVDVMADTHSDIMVFPLRIQRDEVLVDAPTQVDLQRVLPGTYSFQAFKDSLRYTVEQQGGEKAHGGFSNLTAETGAFRGVDGEMVNACLPLYLNEEHWARVSVLLEPVVAYFFTLDAYAFKGDQLLGLVALLGHMHVRRANGQFAGAYADWVIADFTRLCRAIYPRIMRYLRAGKFGARPREDFLDEFLAGPAGRTKEALPNLMVVLGWACMRFDGGFDGMPAEQRQRFLLAFVEEIYRRRLSAFYKRTLKPNPPTATLQNLVYGQAESVMQTAVVEAGSKPQGAMGKADGESDGMAARASGHVVRSNKRSADREYARYALYQWGKLGPKDRRQYGDAWVIDANTDGDSDEDALRLGAGLQLASSKGDEGRQPVPYEADAVFFDACVTQELQAIEKDLTYVNVLLRGAALPETDVHGQIPGAVRRCMLVQALSFLGNSNMTAGLRRGEYLNVFDLLPDAMLRREAGAAASAEDRMQDGGAAPRDWEDDEENVILVDMPSAAAFANAGTALAAAAAADTAATDNSNGARPRSERKRKQRRPLETVFARLHEQWAVQQDDQLAAQVTGAREQLAAIRAVVTTDRVAFAGRMMRFCSTRGTAVFQHVMRLLASGTVHGFPIPMLDVKVGTAMLGTITLKAGAAQPFVVLSNGSSYVTLARETARELRDRIGSDVWAGIESRMIGSWGWVYRASDIPNRHGHCVSNPNPDLGGTFSGFHL